MSRIHLKLSRTELAETIGTAPETVMRLLREFRETAILEVEGREMTVLDVSRLIDLADISS